MENPKIRFKGFTKDWEQRKLGATNTFFTDGNYGEAYPKSSDMTDSGSGVPFLTGGNLKDGKLSLDGASYITPEKHSKLTSGHLLEDDIVIAVRGSLGALGYVNTDNSGWNINSQLAILRTDKSELYGKFLIQYLLSWTGQNELLKRQTGSALKQLPIGAIKDVEVPITSIAEQEKIGEYFDSVDHLITLHQRKCEQTKKLKKYMLQKMFPQNGAKVPEIRFDGFTYDWEQRKLGELGTVQTCKRIFKDQTSEKGDIPFFKNGTIGLKPDSYISREMYEEFRRLYPYPEVGDTLISVVGSIGRTAEYTGKDEYFQDSNVVWLKTDGSINKKFLKISYQVIKWLIEGSTVKHLYNDNILRSEIVMPVSQIEQAKIAEFFEELDHLITLHQRKCDELKKMKKYMLQNMFI